MIWIILIIIGILTLILAGCKSNPDPHFHMWQLVDETTERWKNYCEYMKRMTSDTLVALEMKFYKWVSDWDLWHKLDHWARPDVVWVNKKDDCDGLARLACDMLGRFVMVVLKLITEVHWLEYYGFYRKWYYNKETGEFYYKVVAGGHAICVYRKDGELLAFSNTSWWHDLNFKNYIEIGEQTFPEGLYWVISRHWKTGKMEWQMRAKEGEILKGTNVFHRYLVKMRSIRNLSKAEIEEMKKHA